MGKLRLNLVSGTVVEKPLLSAFKSGENSYVVLDNETNGSMGLPIILVSKLVGDKLIKIEDTTEWQNVKELLKSIIAGNEMEYINIKEEVAADDIYYTQLTLPTPSFDSLKNNYVVKEVASVEVNPVLESAQAEVAAPIDIPIEQPAMENTEIKEESNNLDFGLPLNNTNIEAEITNPLDVVKDNIEPEISPTPVIDTVINTSFEEDKFKNEKEEFLASCEKLFDDLVNKLKNQ